MATPALCQSRVCGPVLDILLGQVPAFADRVRFVHIEVFKSLDNAEIETLSAEISKLPTVDENVTSGVLREFMEMALTKQYITSGGMNYALEILEKALGKNRAVEVVGRIQAAVQPARFSAKPDHLRRSEVRQAPRLLIGSVRATEWAADPPRQ